MVSLKKQVFLRGKFNSKINKFISAPHNLRNAVLKLQIATKTYCVERYYNKFAFINEIRAKYNYEAANNCRTSAVETELVKLMYCCTRNAGQNQWNNNPQGSHRGSILGWRKGVPRKHLPCALRNVGGQEKAMDPLLH